MIILIQHVPHIFLVLLLSINKLFVVVSIRNIFMLGIRMTEMIMWLTLKMLKINIFVLLNQVKMIMEYLITYILLNWLVISPKMIIIMSTLKSEKRFIIMFNYEIYLKF